MGLDLKGCISTLQKVSKHNVQTTIYRSEIHGGKITIMPLVRMQPLLNQFRTRLPTRGQTLALLSATLCPSLQMRTVVCHRLHNGKFLRLRKDPPPDGITNTQPPRLPSRLQTKEWPPRQPQSTVQSPVVNSEWEIRRPCTELRNH